MATRGIIHCVMAVGNSLDVICDSFASTWRVPFAESKGPSTPLHILVCFYFYFWASTHGHLVLFEMYAGSKSAISYDLVSSGRRMTPDPCGRCFYGSYPLWGGYNRNAVAFFAVWCCSLVAYAQLIICQVWSGVCTPGKTGKCTFAL